MTQGERNIEDKSEREEIERKREREKLRRNKGFNTTFNSHNQFMIFCVENHYANCEHPDRRMGIVFHRNNCIKIRNQKGHT